MTHTETLVIDSNFVPSSLIFSTLMFEAKSPPKRRFLTRATLRNIPEDGVLRVLYDSEAD
jgi:hypothetical protein